MTAQPFPHPRHEALWARVEPELPTGDLAHDALHVLRVYHWAVRLAPGAAADPDLAGAAALVHDLVNVPKESAQRSFGGELSAEAAAPVLREVGYAKAEVEAICQAVRRSPWSRGLAPQTPLDRVLQDADRLDAIGAVGIARTFATAQRMQIGGAALALYDEVDPLAHERDAEDRRFALDHFKAKLLTLAAGMHLAQAREEAQRRHAVMEGFLEQLAGELV
jgi:uncharacterized protein